MGGHFCRCGRGFLRLGVILIAAAVGFCAWGSFSSLWTRIFASVGHLCRCGRKFLRLGSISCSSSGCVLSPWAWFSDITSPKRSFSQVFCAFARVRGYVALWACSKTAFFSRLLCRTPIFKHAAMFCMLPFAVNSDTFEVTSNMTNIGACFLIAFLSLWA